jgi:hypothetical protein
VACALGPAGAVARSYGGYDAWECVRQCHSCTMVEPHAFLSSTGFKSLAVLERRGTLRHIRQLPAPCECLITTVLTVDKQSPDDGALEGIRACQACHMNGRANSRPYQVVIGT